MQRRRNRWSRNGFRHRIVRVLVVSLAAMTAIGSAGAEDPETSAGEEVQVSVEETGAQAQGFPADDDWVPSLGLGFFLHVQDEDAGIESGIAAGNPGTSDPMVSPGFRFDASLASPVIVESTFSPRLFLQVGYQLVLEEEFTAFRSIQSSQIPYILNGFLLSTSATQTSAVKTSIDSQWSLGLGMQITVPAWQRNVRLRSTFDYFGQSIGLSGTSSLKVNSPFGGIPSEFYETAVSQKVTSTQHALGTTLQADAVVYRVGNVEVSLFLETRFAWLLDPAAIRATSTLDGETGCVTLPQFNFPVCSNIAVTPDSFIAQGMGGIRFAWIPKWPK